MRYEKSPSVDMMYAVFNLVRHPTHIRAIQGEICTAHTIGAHIVPRVRTASHTH
jgi:hypothetical protein